MSAALIDAKDGESALGLLKIGGSLLAWSGLRLAIKRFIASHTGNRWLLLVGGGTPIDWIADLQNAHGLSDEQAHWLAFHTMRLTGKVLVEILSDETGRPAVIEDISQTVGRGPWIVDPLTELVEHPSDLPATWKTTSDAVAVWWARRMGVKRVVFGKSVSPSTGNAVVMSDAVRAGWIDPVAPLWTTGLSVEWINFRDVNHRLLPVITDQSEKDSEGVPMF